MHRFFLAGNLKSQEETDAKFKIGCLLVTTLNGLMLHMGSFLFYGFCTLACLVPVLNPETVWEKLECFYVF